MKEPVVMKKVNGGGSVTVDGLRTFIKDIYVKDCAAICDFERAVANRFDGIEKAVVTVAKYTDRNQFKGNLALFGIIGIAYLIKKCIIIPHNKDIRELKAENAALKCDYEDLYNKVEQLEAELFEMDNRLHATIKEEDKKEG